MPTELDHYKVLNITVNASEDEIKKSYYKMAKEWHPDKNNSKEAEAKFKEINQAYQILSDTSKRQQYDKQRTETAKTPTATTSTKTTNGSTPYPTYERTNMYSPYNTRFYYEKYKHESTMPNREPSASTRQSKTKFRPFDSTTGTGATNRSYTFKDFFENNPHLFDGDTDSDDEENEYLYELLTKRRQTNRARPKWNNKWAFDSDMPTSGNPSQPKSTEQQFNDIFEEYSMYKMFKDISARLFQNDIHNPANDRLLINLTYIIKEMNNAMGRDVYGEQRHFHNLYRPQPHHHQHGHHHGHGHPSFNRMPRTNTRSNQSQDPKQTEWQFDWLGKESTKNKNNEEDDDDSDKNESFENVFYCQFCTRPLSDEDSLLKHETICKRLSHNQQSQAQPQQAQQQSNKRYNKITKCPLCKVDLDSYEYLVHNCSNFKDTEVPDMDESASRAGGDYTNFYRNNSSADFTNADIFAGRKYTSSAASNKSTASTRTTATATPSHNQNYYKSNFNFTSKTQLPKKTSAFNTARTATQTPSANTGIKREKMKHDIPLR